MLVAEVGERQLRAEVQVAPAVGIGDVAAEAADEGPDGARPLHRPRTKDQLVGDARRLRSLRGPSTRAKALGFVPPPYMSTITSKPP